jgi:hypothetical protein
MKKLNERNQVLSLYVFDRKDRTRDVTSVRLTLISFTFFIRNKSSNDFHLDGWIVVFDRIDL